MEFVVSEKALERGKKYLEMTWTQQEGVRKRIKKAESAIELAKGIIGYVKRAFEVHDAKEIIKLAKELGAPETEIQALSEAEKAKYQELDRAEYTADIEKAKRIWEEARPELEKKGLIAEWLKEDKYYRARCYKGRSTRIIFKRDWSNSNVLEAWYKPTGRSKREYRAFSIRREYRREAENAQRQIKAIEFWEIKPLS